MKSNENFLKALLINRQDLVAVEYGEFYPEDTCRNRQELFIFALNNSNEMFLKYAFRDTNLGPAIFSADNFKYEGDESPVISEIFKMMDEGVQTELILNTLIFAEIGKWKHEDVATFLEFIEEMISTDIEPNLMMMCYNPIQVICLSCEIL